MKARASKELCAFVRQQAPPHYPANDAPDTWAKLQDWHARYSRTQPMPVFNGGCDATIYPDAETNHAFRAWHDSIHCTNGYGFNLEDEIRVGLIHMQQARRAGLSCLDQNMLVADTIGQIQYYYERNAFVKDQARFVGDVLDKGLRTVLDSGEVY